jgi:hypothetical protein
MIAGGAEMLGRFLIDIVPKSASEGSLPITAVKCDAVHKLVSKSGIRLTPSQVEVCISSKSSVVDPRFKQNEIQ